MAEPAASAAAVSPQSLTSIVVATDFSPCSAVAVAQAIRIGSWARATVHVVHVIDTVVVIELEHALSSMQQNIRNSLIDDATLAWKSFATTIPGASDLPVEVVINNRIVGILGCAREHNADLLIVGAFGHSPPDLGMGTVASACVRKSASNVLLVRDTQPGAFNSIVAAVDFSDTSALALVRAADFAAGENATLHAVHIFEAPWQQVNYGRPQTAETHRLQADYRDQLVARLHEFVKPAAAAYPNLRLQVSCHDSFGHRSGIVEFARSVTADLIVLGTRGRTNLRDILLGSTAEEALHESHCSVLAVKPHGFSHALGSGAAV